MTPAAPRLPRLGILAADPLRILGIQTILEDGTRFEVLPLSDGRAAGLQDLEVVILDATSTDHLLDLVSAFQQLRPYVRLLVLGEETGYPYMESLIEAGVKGYLLHASTQSDLCSAVDVVRDGSLWVPRKVLSQLIERRFHPRAKMVTTPARLTSRERQVLALLLDGRPNREIGSSLGLQEGTIKSYMARLMRKAEVNNRTALMVRAAELGWLTSST